MSAPNYIKALFPVGSEISFVEEGVTKVLIPGERIERSFTERDLFKVLMLKEWHPSFVGVLYNEQEGAVVDENGVTHTYPQTDLDKALDGWNDFFITNSFEGFVDVSVPDAIDQGNGDNPDPTIHTGNGDLVDALATFQASPVHTLYKFKENFLQPFVFAHAVAKLALKFIRWDPNPEGRPGQGKANTYDKCGNQIPLNTATTRMRRGEIVYIVKSYADEPFVLNIEMSYINTYPITDYGCFFVKDTTGVMIQGPTPSSMMQNQARPVYPEYWMGAGLGSIKPVKPEPLYYNNSGEVPDEPLFYNNYAQISNTPTGGTTGGSSGTGIGGFVSQCIPLVAPHISIVDGAPVFDFQGALASLS